MTTYTLILAVVGVVALTDALFKAIDRIEGRR